MIVEDINIIVEAQGAETRQIVASLINNTLAGAGFTNIDTGVATREDATSTIIETDKMPSMLDAMREANPAMFERRVTLLAMPWSTYEPRADHPLLMKDRPDLAEPAPAPEYSPGYKAAVLDIVREGVVSAPTVELIREEKEAGTFVGNEEAEEAV
jgi:hypothetical protein